MITKLVYSLRGLPTEYLGVAWTDTKYPIAKIPTTIAKIDKAPTTGVLLVSGTAAPVVNQLMVDRKVVGLNFPEYYQSKLSNEETMDLPKGPVVLIHGIGAEPANNAQFASKILGSLMNSYKGVLVILQTDKTPSNFQTTYGLLIANSLIIPEKEVDKWI